jgi:GrpB-like predicted nucleotidyltransferase (UPF0157 family)
VTEARAPRTAGYQPSVVVVDPDPAWPSVFADESARLHEALGDLVVRIEHHGFTSVPGLAAKPIIDIQVTVARLDVDEIARRLEGIGYAHVPWPGDADGYPFFAKPPEGFRTHHVHACLPGSLEESRHLVFRDYLRAHPEEADAYAQLKRELIERHGGERQGYVDGKDAYVKALQERAVAWDGANRP